MLYYDRSVVSLEIIDLNKDKIVNTSRIAVMKVVTSMFLTVASRDGTSECCSYLTYKAFWPTGRRAACQQWVRGRRTGPHIKTGIHKWYCFP